MSTLAKTTLTASVTFTCGMIYYVHYSQKRDMMRLKEGVVMDMERQQRKRKNIQQLELQADLTKILIRQRDEQDKLDQQTTLTNQSRTEKQLTQ